MCTEASESACVPLSIPPTDLVLLSGIERNESHSHWISDEHRVNRLGSKPCPGRLHRTLRCLSRSAENRLNFDELVLLLELLLYRLG